jgi:virginiamycin B lyase
MLRVFSIGFLLCAAVLSVAAQNKDSVKGSKPGIQKPGVQIPLAKLRAEAELATAGLPGSIIGEQSVWVLNVDKNSIDRIDPKTNKMTDSVAGLNQPCSNLQFGFDSVWVLNCGDETIAKIDSKKAAITRTLKTGGTTKKAVLAVSADSVWAITDPKTTLIRVDPVEDKIVAEMRLPAGCNSIAFGESALWATCPQDNQVLRIDPILNLVKERIEVGAGPFAIAVGEGAVWVFCRKEGKVDRIDPKTNKVSKTIELTVPNADADITVGEGSVWVTLPGFPISRIDPKTGRVMQQFVGEGGGVIRTAQGAIWLSNVRQGSVWRLDPRRIAATLAE